MLLFLRQLFMMRVCVCVCVCGCVCACACLCVVIVHWHCSAQLSMFNMEKRYRNKIIIINVSNKNTPSMHHPRRWNVIWVFLVLHSPAISLGFTTFG